MADLRGKLVKVGGFALVIVALSYAFDPNWPIPLGQVRGSADRPPVISGPPVHSLVIVQDHEALAPTFLWRSDRRGRSWRVVLLDANRQEIAWSAPTAKTIYRPKGEFRDALIRGHGRYWYAVGDVTGSVDATQPPRVSSAVVPINAVPPR